MTERLGVDIPCIQSLSLSSIEPCRHGFFTRKGGVSEGAFASLNCGFRSGDEIARVQENRARVAARLSAPANALISLKQVHSATSVRVDSTSWNLQAIEADGMVTKRPDACLSVLGADCAPVLLIEPQAGVIGALHAGWRGALSGVVQSVVGMMVREGADEDHIRASIGPTIAVGSYEIGDDFRQSILSRNERYETFFCFNEETQKHHFDLPAFVAHQLEDAGVSQIDDIGIDTCANKESFFSYRRSALRGERNYGLHISVIGLAGS